MEILNHILGTCGEFHPNILTVSILLLPFIWVNRKKISETFIK